LYIQIPNLISRGVLRATLIKLCFVLAGDLHVNILKFVARDGSVVQPASINIVFGANMRSNIVEHINWVLSELSVVVHKMLNRTQGRSQDFSKGGAEVMEAKALKRKSCL